MKKWVLFILIFMPFMAGAHCPIEINVENELYCMDLTWGEGEKKVRNQFFPTTALSPHLIPMGEVPQKWVYSQVYISVWEKGDSTHQAVEIPNFRVFPYMYMENGHNHSTGYDFFYETQESLYVLRGVGFQQMRGCWTLRWTIAEEDSEVKSRPLIDITEFSNLNSEQVRRVENYCQQANRTLQPSMSHDHGGSHHHHGPGHN